MKRVAYFCLFTLSLFATGCQKEEKKEEKKLEVSPTEIVVYTEETKQITTNVDDAQFSSQDDFYASVETSGLMKGNKVGSTNILVSSSIGTAKIPVKILNKYSLYPDLDGYIGKSLSDITKLMGSNYQTSKTAKGEPMYGYLNPTSYTELIGFTLSNNKCSSIIVAVPTTHTSMLTKYLIERYTVAGTQNDYYFFLNHDKNVVIGLSVYSASLLAVIYVENTDSKSSDAINMSLLKELSSFSFD